MATLWSAAVGCDAGGVSRPAPVVATTVEADWRSVEQASVEPASLRVDGANGVLRTVRGRYLAERDEDYLDPDDEQAAVDHALDTALRAPVRPQTSLRSAAAPGPRPDKPLCANLAGFSLHAARTVAAHDREGLERLCRYGLRVPFAPHRLSVLADGRVR